jgi:hypothetical protein
MTCTTDTLRLPNRTPGDAFTKIRQQFTRYTSGRSVPVPWATLGATGGTITVLKEDGTVVLGPSALETLADDGWCSYDPTAADQDALEQGETYVVRFGVDFPDADDAWTSPDFEMVMRSQA